MLQKYIVTNFETILQRVQGIFETYGYAKIASFNIEEQSLDTFKNHWP